MGNINSEQKELTSRQLRRRQQREASLAAKEAVATAAETSASKLPPLSPPPEILGPSVMVPMFCSSIVLGCLLFHISGFATLKGNELSWPQPLFAAVNAATLTGFQQARNPSDYTNSGQLLTVFLTIGGILFSLVCGGVAVLRIARLRFKDLHLIAWAFASLLIVSIIGGICLQGGDHRYFQGAFRALSAFGNSGLTIDKTPDSSGIGLVFIVLPLVVLGGLGLPVLMDIANHLRKKSPLSRHSRTVLLWSAGVYLALTVLLFAMHFSPDHGSIRSMVIDSAEQSINSRSAGFAFATISNLPATFNLVLVIAMIIGASPGGTGGGIKVTTLATITTGTRECLAGRTPGRRFGTALIWLGTYLGLLLVATIALVISDPELPLDKALFLAASALGNVGLSHNPIDASASMYVLSGTMLVGRVAPVLMLWYLIDTTPDADVAVG